MKILVLSICAFFIITAPAYSMEFPNTMTCNGMPYAYDHASVQNDVRSVRHSTNPEAQARLLLDQTRDNPKPYVNYALKNSKALTAFIAAGASVTDQIGDEYPLDTALCTDNTKAITILASNPNIPFDAIKYDPISLGFAEPNTILHFSKIYYLKAPDPERAMELTTQITQHCPEKVIDQYLSGGGQLYLPPYQRVYETLSIAHPIFYIKPLMHYARRIKHAYSSSTADQHRAYDNAVKCALLALVARQNQDQDYELLPPSLFYPGHLVSLYSHCAYEISKYHPYTMKSEMDVSLAWDIIALALDGNNKLLTSCMKNDLAKESKPLPNRTFLSQLLAYCIHKRRPPETLRLCITELEECKNLSTTGKQSPLLVLLHDKKNQSSLATTSIQDAAAETGDPEIVALFNNLSLQ